MVFFLMQCTYFVPFYFGFPPHHCFVVTKPAKIIGFYRIFFAWNSTLICCFSCRDVLYRRWQWRKWITNLVSIAVETKCEGIFWIIATWCDAQHVSTSMTYLIFYWRWLYDDIIVVIAVITDVVNAGHRENSINNCP